MLHCGIKSPRATQRLVCNPGVVSETLACFYASAAVNWFENKVNQFTAARTPYEPGLHKALHVVSNAMTATIYSNKLIIGTAQLEIGDESMGGVFGPFLPNDNYFNHIQHSVWEFWSTSKPDYKKWYSLRFNAQLDNGFFLFPIGGYTIDDIEGLKDQPKRIDIAGIDLTTLYLGDKILLDPWRKITIEQKIGLEDELKKELSQGKNILSKIFSSDRIHVLKDTEFSAVASHRPSDDVLFAINNRSNDNKFAVVHLTWKGEKEKFDNCPFTHLYKDFDDFITRRMKSDHDDWDN
jgi:hypothetical protein